MSRYKVLREAEFSPKLARYWQINGLVICISTIILIPVAPIWFVLSGLFIRKYIERLKCTLTTRTLEIERGWLNRVESTVPLEKITDLQQYQGPIMRWLGIHGFKVETAGQTAGPGGSLVAMTGIVDTPGFREAVLDQRDRIHEKDEGDSAGTPSPAGGAREAAGDDGVLVEIRDSLLRIEERLNRG